jgi:hypothetical protein
MALDFPTNPTNGQVYDTFYYDSSITAWRNLGSKNALSDSITALQNNKLSPNYIINGGFDIWQRGTSIAGNAFYNADRWTQARSGGATGATVTRQAAGLTGFQYCARVQRDSTNTNTAILYHTQSFETVNSLALAGKTVTLSFWARSGANFSAASSMLTANILSSTGTDQNFASVALTGQATVATLNATLTSTWTKFSVTGTVSSSATQVHVQTLFTPVGTAGANDYFEIAGVQLEEGSIATPFRRHAPSIQGELAACQRYYWRQTASGTDTPYGYGLQPTTTIGEATISAPVSLRTNPTSVEYSGIGWSDAISFTAAVASLLIQYGNAGTSTFHLRCTFAANGATRYPGRISATSANSYIGFNAEL